MGSAFNPPHLGHLVLAQEAVYQLLLDEVVLVPTGVAPHKQLEEDPGAAVRLELARVAAADGDTLSVSELETAREEPSYTYRTLELLDEEQPDVELVLLMGADAALGLEGWRRPERIAELARLAVADRAGVGRAAVETVLERVGATTFDWVDMPRLEVSSSMLRRRVREGRPVRHLVPQAVAELIERRGLYGA